MQLHTGSRPEPEDDNDFDQEENNSSPKFLRTLSGLFFVAAVGGFLALAWYAYKGSTQPVNEADIPLVAEDAEPVKEAPKDPGGWQFDHQDKSVYNQLAAGKGSESAPVAERIMPAPEEPIQRPAPLPVEQVTPAPNQTAPAQEVGMHETTSVEQVSAAPEENKKPVQHQMVETGSVIPVPAEEVKAVPVAGVKEQKTESKKEAQKPATGGNFMAQLGAFSTQAEAEKTWGKVSAAHGSKFPTKNYKISKADLGAKGVFYRLQMGPFESESAARNLCSYLKEKKQVCFIVKG